MTAVLRDRPGGVVEIGLDEVAPVLGVERGRKAGRPDQIAEHNGDGSPLRFVPHTRRGDSGRHHLQRRQARDRLEDALAVTERQAELFEVVLGQLGNDVHVDQVVAKSGLMPFKSQTS
jgi:hypothetical protein